MTLRWKAIGAGLVSFVMLAAFIPTAHGAFPGRNGRIVYADKFAGELRTMLPDGSRDRLLVSLPGAVEPSYSADGSKIVFVGGDGADLYLVNSDGSNLHPVLETQEGVPTFASEPTFSPSGERIAFSDFRSIYTVNVDGTALRRLTSISGPGGFIRSPAWSPDGSTIAYSRLVDEFARRNTWTMRPDGSQKRRLPNGRGASFLDYSPDGRHLVFKAGVIHTIRADGTHRRPIQGPAAYGLDPAFPTYSPNGRQIATVLRETGGICCRSRIRISNQDGSDWRELSPPEGHLFRWGISWQPLPRP